MTIRLNETPSRIRPDVTAEKAELFAAVATTNRGLLPAGPLQLARIHDAVRALEAMAEPSDPSTLFVRANGTWANLYCEADDIVRIAKNPLFDIGRNCQRIHAEQRVFYNVVELLPRLPVLPALLSCIRGEYIDSEREGSRTVLHLRLDRFIVSLQKLVGYDPHQPNVISDWTRDTERRITKKQTLRARQIPIDHPAWWKTSYQDADLRILRAGGRYAPPEGYLYVLSRVEG